jgi:hypothetical protein
MNTRATRCAWRAGAHVPFPPTLLLAPHAASVSSAFNIRPTGKTEPHYFTDSRSATFIHLRWLVQSVRTTAASGPATFHVAAYVASPPASIPGLPVAPPRAPPPAVVEPP